MGCNCNSCKDLNNDESKERIFLIIRGIISLIIFIVSLFLNGILKEVFIILAYLLVSIDVLFKAFKNILHLEFFDECFLMSLASLIALIVPIFMKDSLIDSNDGYLVMLLYQIGEFLSDLAVDKSNDSLTSMLSLNVNKAIRVNKIKEEEIDLSEIKVNDILRVKPGMEIPIDGIVVNGNTCVNSSMLTGESKPIDINVNDKVLAGFVNIDGTIDIKASVTIKDSLVSKIKEEVENAKKNKAKQEDFIAKFAKIYTPIVILVSLVIMFVIPLFLGFKENFLNYLAKGLSIMVVSCPCSLVISIPLAFFLGIGKGAKNAILFKGANQIENYSKVKAFAFDKTGTLTKGTFEVIKLESNDEPLLRKLAYNIERNGTHPIAKSIVQYLENEEVLEVIDFKNIVGFGASGYIDNKKVLVGNKKLLDKYNIKYPNISSSGSVIYVAIDNNYLGYFIISDVLKDDSLVGIQKINEKYDTYLISGDNKDTCEEISNYLNIKHCYFEKLPLEKEEIIEKIKEKKEVAYIGDGINDAASLLKASVGISMKSLGSDLAIKASDIVIMDNKVSKVAKAKEIANKVMKIVYENIVFSIVVKVTIIVLAIIMVIPMYLAIIGDVGVCLLAILNALRVLYGK